MAGPPLGALTAVVLYPALFAIGALVHLGSGAYRVSAIPGVVVGSVPLGLVGGATVGVIGGAGVWLLDRFAGQRPNGRTDAALAAGVTGLLTGLSALVVLSDVGVAQAWDLAFWLLPVPVLSVVAASAAGRIWFTTRHLVVTRPERQPRLASVAPRPSSAHRPASDVVWSPA